MIRRVLHKLFPAASAVSSLLSKGEPVVVPTLTEAGFSISIQCWSFKEFTLFEAIEMAAAAGAGGVELYPGQRLGGGHGDLVFSEELPDAKLQAVIDHLEKNHIAALNLGVVDFPEDETKARKLFDLAKNLNLYGVTTESANAIDTLEKLSQEYGIKVCFHNHPKPTALWHPDTVWKLLEGRHENLGFCADIGHWASSGLDPLEVVRKIAPRIRSFHLKDRASISEWTHDRPFGTGIFDLPAILAAARHHGFAGNVSIEYEHNWQTSLPEIAQCAGYLRAYAKLR
ncbi:MAG: sugar phosphate isomerase/epimerase [Luteolibacter sp.]